MTFLDHLSFPSIHKMGPTVLALAAVFTTALLARPRRSGTAGPRRPGSPKGIARWLVAAALALAALLALGIDLQGLWSTVAAALSLLAIGFVAMWSLLSHMLASVLIVIFRPFEEGDRVAIVGDDPVVGEVIELNPVYTTLRTEDGGTLQVPNNLFFQKAVKRAAPLAAPAHPSPSPALREALPS
jgi:small-conductance mechanosensitive channel